MVKEIRLTNSSRVALVDDQDFDLVNQYQWAESKTGRHTQYAVHDRRNGGNRVYIIMHRLIMNAPGGMVVDHINGNGLDNRRANLRICTIAQNLLNQPKRNGRTSSYRGVAFCSQTRRWKARVQRQGKSIWLGRFASEEDAARAVDAALVEHHGEFAHLNFPKKDQVA